MGLEVYTITLTVCMRAPPDMRRPSVHFSTPGRVTLFLVFRLMCLEDIRIKGCKRKIVQAWILCKLASLSQHVEAHVECSFVDLSETWGVEMKYLKWWKKEEITQTTVLGSPFPILSSPGISFSIPPPPPHPPRFFFLMASLFEFLGKAGIRGQNSTGRF